MYWLFGRVHINGYNLCYYYKALINILGVARHEKLPSSALYNMHKVERIGLKFGEVGKFTKKKGKFLTTCCPVAKTCTFSHIPERDEQTNEKTKKECFTAGIANRTGGTWIMVHRGIYIQKYSVL